MNYSFQFPRTVPLRPLDYSRWNLAALNEGALIEDRGIDDNAPPAGLAAWGKTTFTHYDAGTDKCVFETANAVGDIDWNWSVGPAAGTPVAAGINEPDSHAERGRWRLCQPGGGARRSSAATTTGPTCTSTTATSPAGTSSAPATRSPNPAPELTEDEQRELAEISDSDGDGVDNADDNCNLAANPGQEDSRRRRDRRRLRGAARAGEHAAAGDRPAGEPPRDGDA